MLSIPNKLLADFVRSEMEKNSLSLREVARRSNGRITYGAVDDIVNERTKSPSIATISGLAKGLGVAEDELFDIARGVSRGQTELQAKLHYLIDGLSPFRQYDLLKMAELYFAEQTENEDLYGSDIKVETFTESEKEEYDLDFKRFMQLNTARRKAVAGEDLSISQNVKENRNAGRRKESETSASPRRKPRETTATFENAEIVERPQRKIKLGDEKNSQRDNSKVSPIRKRRGK